VQGEVDASAPADFMAVHRQFLEQQAEVHRRFLRLQEDLQQKAVAALATPAAAAVAAPAEWAAPAASPAPAPAVPLTPVPAAPSPADRGAPQELTPSTPAEAREMPAVVAAPPAKPLPSGPRLDRAQVEVHGAGRISEIFGPLFERQDGFRRQVRMPDGALLLADRVTGIDAEPGVLGTGTIWTETDVRPDSWYLHQGRMPGGVLIESGQADLMLISYMGADFLNRGERVYRLLGCRLTFEADLPRPGDTLTYDIHVDGHAKQDDIRLFFFHYDCVVDGRPQIRVREGQAGFFSDAELASSAGVLWSPEDVEPCAEPRLHEPERVCGADRFSAAQLRSFAEGRAWECFGPEWDLCQTHTQSPAIQGGRMLFLGEVTCFEARGGPWGRGYLRAETEIRPDDWYFEGHFLGDPCMPGTLMFEGCLQAMSFYLAALGFTVERDGWRFQPVTGEEIDLRCRGQVTPTSERILYEVFVEEVVAEPVPTLYADVLCTVDGLKAFHARRVGLKLVPDWPLESSPELLDGYVEPKPVALVPTPAGPDFELGYASLLACAWGRPSTAFGPMYERFDGPQRVPRLPGPPYHFLSRVSTVDGPIGGMQVGSRVEVEYDVPPDAWYLAENGARTMPFAVLLEAALQPCGWLASYIGSALTSDGELAFRNLDGTGTLEAEIFEHSGTLRTQVELTGLARSAGTIIVNFRVECFLGERRAYELTTVFGFFPPAALVEQIGLPTGDAERALLQRASDYRVDLRDLPDRFFGGSARLGRERLRMLDRVSGFWPEEGEKGLGLLLAERDIDVGDWYFKAHFFQDPVQPGSLGIEAMVQLLQFYMLETGMHEGIDEPRFEPLALGHALTWKYRGQVVPHNRLVHVTLEITEIGSDAEGAWAVGKSSLWCDGIRIYSAENLGMRLVSGAPPPGRGGTGPTPRRGEPKAPPAPASASVTLDPAVDLWLGDHRPTWQRPALPMMAIADLLAAAVSPLEVVDLSDLQLKEWVDFEGPRRLETRVEELDGGRFDASLWAEKEAGEPLVEVARARVRTGSPSGPPPALPACSGSKMPDPYDEGSLFHGPAFQLWREGVLGAEGASALLDAGAGTVPTGVLHPALLDAALHSIPHDRLSMWSDEIAEDRVAYPARISRLAVYGPVPTSGEVRAEVRFDGFLAKPDLPRFEIQLIVGDRVWAEMSLVEACFPKGPLGSAPPRERRAFLRDGIWVEGLSLSRRQDDRTRVSQAEIEASDWMPGTIEAVYGTRDLESIAIKEHLAARERLHPRHLPQALPLTRPAVSLSRDEEDVVVCDDPAEWAAGARLDLAPLREFWEPLLGVAGAWAGRDLMEGLIQRYVRRVVVTDPVGLAAVRGRGAIFVGNHQVQIESILITHILGGLAGTPLVTMANAKHESRWIGWLLRTIFSYPGCRDPRSILYFDPKQPESMFDIVARLREFLGAGGRSFFVHCQGTRARSCREPTDTISSLFLDLAIEQDLPIVPVRFSGGLPVVPLEGKLEFPLGHGRQDYSLGSPIAASELAALAYGERPARVLDALAALSGPVELEDPLPPDPSVAQSVADWCSQTGTGEVEAALYRVLEAVPEPSALTSLLLEGAASGRLELPAGPEGKWLAGLAGPLYGDHGPEIRTAS
jgi:3-hydroxymyristoyl/3-hydroxydecanoyl-(acyl carrier protein) dehydratase/1-acyl-sn-glycerol-3-phosphate acyltransferase